MRRFAYEPARQRILFGAGVARQALATECDRLGTRRLLLLTTPGEAARSHRVLDGVAGLIAGRFTGVRTHVPVEVATAAHDAAAEAGADGLLCIGGGAATGTAKAVALETGLPIVAVPTTYAGSEVTPVWGLTKGRRKSTGRSAAVLPRVVLYDPELTLAMPAGLTAASGMNALAHCVDALGLPAADPISGLLAQEGVRILAAGLPAVAADGSDLVARTEVLYGAFVAGSAFAGAGSGVHHGMCHVLGGLFDLPHAQTHAVLLPHVAAYLERVAPAGMDRVRNALGADQPVARALHSLATRIGAPLSLRELGLADADLDEAVDLVAEHTGMAATDVRHILDAARGGVLDQQRY